MSAQKPYVVSSETLLRQPSPNCIFTGVTQLSGRYQLTQMPERRSDQRVSLNLDARWDGLSGGHEARIEDLSLGGCFVNTTGRVDVGEEVVIEIKLPAGDWLQIPAKVVASQHGIGFGVVFSLLTEIDEEAIQELIPKPHG